MINEYILVQAMGCVFSLVGILCLTIMVMDKYTESKSKMKEEIN